MEEEQKLDIPDSLADTPEAACTRQLQTRRQWLRRLGLWSTVGMAGAAAWYWTAPPIAPLYFDGLHAFAHVSHPQAVHRIVGIANQIVDKPYKWGGGHQVLFDNGFDCSGSISHVLYRSGLLQHASTSAAFLRYGMPGPGNYVTLYVKPGHHVFMEVCGLRFDTSGQRAGEGPRWRVPSRDRQGFYARHPAWL